MANKFIKEPVGDGGCPRIPTLREEDREGIMSLEVRGSEEKARLLARTFFPPPPSSSSIPPDFAYPNPLPDPPKITIKKVKHHIRRLSPYKACPDDIPNIVLQQCVDLLSQRLLVIYQAILNLGIYFDPWREFTTIVIRKPGKPNYEIPKVYRPIALLSTMAKVLTGIVAEDMSRLVERHQLLPNILEVGQGGPRPTPFITW